MPGPVVIGEKYFEFLTDDTLDSTEQSEIRTQIGSLSTSLKGAANGLAELDSNSKIPEIQLPNLVGVYPKSWGAYPVDYFTPGGSADVEEDATEFFQNAILDIPRGGILSLLPRSGGDRKNYVINTAEGSSIAVIDKPMTILGNKNCCIKIKEFSDGWAASAKLVYAVVIKSSHVIIDGLIIDCDADHHYEVDGEGYKWWEAGPTSKRPPSGILVSCDADEEQIHDVIISGCVIERPLTGITVNGDPTAFTEDPSSFFDGTIDHSICRGVRVINNQIVRSRGNSIMISSGVIDCSAENNWMANSMYHPVRCYTWATDITIRGNTSHVDYGAIENTYNSSDLGYWRTNKTGDEQYPIRRAGFRLGSGFSDDTEDFNIRRCSILNNVASWSPASQSSSIIDPGSATEIAGVTAVSVGDDITISGNLVKNSPRVGILTTLSSIGADGTDESKGIIISENTILSAYNVGILSQSKGSIISKNLLRNCCSNSDAGITRTHILCGAEDIKLINNEIHAGESTILSLRVITATSNADNFIGVGNKLIGGFTDPYFISSSISNIVTSRRVPITLENGWDNVAGASTENPLSLVVNSDNTATLIGYISGNLASSGTVGSVPESSAPMYHVYCAAVQALSSSPYEPGDIYMMSVNRSGLIQINIGDDNPNRLFISCTWSIDPVYTL